MLSESGHRPIRPQGATLFQSLRGGAAGSKGDAPEAFDPAVVERVLTKVGRLFGPGRYFRLEARGLEHLPPPPVMLVGNHSGGTSIPDVWGLATAWYRQFGTKRPLHILGHELIFATHATASFFERCGVLRATPGLGHDVLTEFGRDLLVLPGGDRDTWRPWTQRWDVNFGGRTGYARLAIDTQVPIVPVAHAGAHETLMVLSSGRRLAKWLGLQRLARAEIFPVHLSLPWGLGIGPLPHLPLPAKFQYVFGSPLIPVPPEVRSEADVEALDHEVRVTLQSMLDALKHERTH